MEKFYFTYGSDDSNQAFNGGWTEVTAPDEYLAREIFRSVHPSSGLLPCAGVYDEPSFRRTRMYKEGNFGARCHERIDVTVTRI